MSLRCRCDEPLGDDLDNKPDELVDRARNELPPSPTGLMAVLVTATVIAMLYSAREVFIPIALAVLLSFLLAPAVRQLRRWRLGRAPAICLTVLLAFAAIAGVVVVIAEEVTSLAEQLPEYRYNLESKIRSLPGMVPGGGVFGRATETLQDLGKELTNADSPRRAGDARPASATKPVPVRIEDPEPGALLLVQSIIAPLLQPVAAGGLVLVFVILILLEREDLRDRVLRLAGRHDLHRTTQAMNDAAQRISRYLLSQLIVNVSCGLPISIGLAFLGIPNAALWGMMVVLLRFIPYLGIVIAAAFPLALAIAVAPDWMLFVWTGLLFIGIELIVSNIIEPHVYGGTTGVSPVALIAAATLWAWLWGPIGLLLSTPMTVCLVVLGRHVPRLQFLDILLGNEPVLTPSETFYQRLLANDPEEATEQAEDFTKDRSLSDFLNEVAMPALARAQADSDRGAFTSEHRNTFKNGIEAMLENLVEDGTAGSTVEGAGVPQPERLPKIVCVAGRNELDEAAALLLTSLLRSDRRIEVATPLPAAALAADIGYSVPFKDASVVCLSLISTSSPARARYLVRRIRRRAPAARILVAFWGSQDPPLSLEEMTRAISAQALAFSLSDAVIAIDSMLMPAGEFARAA
jgi:predicted PurR-regulated permease PerM